VSATPVDLFPHTPHCELVLLLERVMDSEVKMDNKDHLKACAQDEQHRAEGELVEKSSDEEEGERQVGSVKGSRTLEGAGVREEVRRTEEQRLEEFVGSRERRLNDEEEEGNREIVSVTSKTLEGIVKATSNVEEQKVERNVVDRDREN